MKKEYAKEFKQHVVGEHFAGSTVSALAKEYVEHYNSRRPHEFLNYRSPDAYEMNYFKKQISLEA